MIAEKVYEWNISEWYVRMTKQNEKTFSTFYQEIDLFFVFYDHIIIDVSIY